MNAKDESVTLAFPMVIRVFVIGCGICTDIDSLYINIQKTNNYMYYQFTTDSFYSERIFIYVKETDKGLKGVVGSILWKRFF
jgi:hypothetical protein